METAEPTGPKAGNELERDGKEPVLGPPISVTVRVKVEDVTPEEMDAPEALWESQSTQLEPPQPHPAWGSPEEAALRKCELPGAPGKEPRVGQEMGPGSTVTHVVPSQVTVRVKVEEVTPEEVETPEALWESQSSQLEPPQPNTTWGSQEEVGRSKYKLPRAPEEETEALQETAGARILSRAEERPNLGEQENLDLARTSQGGSGESVARRLEQEEACKRQKRNSAGNERIPPR
ncbi:hypothetical protein KIL84_001705, partial [Mauremys mutica]